MADIEKVINGLECCNNRKDCKHCPYVTDSDPNLDCIDKTGKDAIKLLKEQRETITNLEDEIRNKNIRLNERAEQVERLLKEQKRPKGKWTERQYGFCGTCHARCSVCGKWSAGYSKETIGGNEYFFYPFCCNCGAEMEKDGDDKCQN